MATSGMAKLKIRAYGLVFIAVLAGLVSLSVAA
jgi:hypothetical protein